jgi:hypothetical protein
MAIINSALSRDYFCRRFLRDASKDRSCYTLPASTNSNSNKDEPSIRDLAEGSGEAAGLNSASIPLSVLTVVSG